MCLKYRTILICEARNDCDFMVYGHTIDWYMTDLDYTITDWQYEDIKGNIRVFFKDISDLSEITKLLTDGEMIINTKGDRRRIVFKSDKTDERFLAKIYDEKSYNPFISYCTYVKYYFIEGIDVLGQPIRDFILFHSDALELIEKKFAIPLKRHPYMISTFAHFIPTRLLEYVNGYESNGEKGYELIIKDEFNKYADAQVTIFTESGTLNDKKSFRLIETPPKIITGFVPDYFRTEIHHQDQQIYLAEAHMIKSISLDLRINSGKIRVGDNVIDTFSRHESRIGK